MIPYFDISVFIIAWAALVLLQVFLFDRLFKMFDHRDKFKKSH